VEIKKAEVCQELVQLVAQLKTYGKTGINFNNFLKLELQN
jgi:hypothetical protein